MTEVTKQVIFEKELSVYLIEKAPYQIPENWRASIVKWIPIADLILLILLAPLVLGLLGLSIGAAGWLAGYGYPMGFRYWLSILFVVAFIILRALALPGLFARKRFGWELLYYCALLGVLDNIIGFDIVGLLFDVLSLYVLFQVKSAYQ